MTKSPTKEDLERRLAISRSRHKTTINELLNTREEILKLKLENEKLKKKLQTLKDVAN